MAVLTLKPLIVRMDTNTQDKSTNKKSGKGIGQRFANFRNRRKERRDNILKSARETAKKDFDDIKNIHSEMVSSIRNRGQNTSKTTTEPNGAAPTVVDMNLTDTDDGFFEAT